MLSDTKSYAHGLQELCFGLSRAMLCTVKSYALHFQELCSTTFWNLLFMISSRSRYPAVVVSGSRQACSTGVARQFRARFQAELLHLDRSFWRADLPSPLLLVCWCKVTKNIRRVQLETPNNPRLLHILTHKKMTMCPKALLLESWGGRGGVKIEEGGDNR